MSQKEFQKVGREESLHFCGGHGKEGRIARSVIRDALQGYSSPYVHIYDAIDHVSLCRRCQHRINEAIERDPDNTTYRGTCWEEVVKEISEMKGYLKERPIP